MRALLLLLLVAGCKEQPATTAAPDGAKVVATATADARAVEKIANDKPDAAALGDPPTVPAPTNGRLGVPACDEYLDKMTRCIAHLSADAQGPMREGLEDSRKAWTASAATPEGRKALEPTCKQALEVAKSAAAAMGCEW